MLTAAQSPSGSAQSATPSWMIVGTFKGASETGLLGQLSNYVFEYERDESLFRDFGDLGFGIGGDVGSVSVNLDLNFRHRLVTHHEVLPPGETITAKDLSVLRKVPTSRVRLRADYEYLPEIITDEDGIAIQVEGGYSVSASRAVPPRIQSTDPLAGLIAEPEEADSEEKKSRSAEFRQEHDINLKDHGVVYVTAGSAASVVDSISGAIGKRFADTEKAAIYWDEYAEPYMLFPKTGLPLKLRVFLPGNDTLVVGDRLTFTSFVGVSPVVVGIDQYGARLGWKYFFRFIRETTVEKEPNGFVKVRVRNWRGHGSELTPFKYRPEARIWFFTIGYTFFETVRDDYRERSSDEVYRIDLKSPSGMEFFKKIVKQSARVNPNPKLPSRDEIEGMEVLASEVTKGKNRNFRLRANFFSWFRLRNSKLATTRRISTQNADLLEAVRVRSREYSKRIGRDQDIRSRSVIIAQSDVRWQDDVSLLQDGVEVHREDEKLAVLISTNYANRWASAAEIRALAEGVDAILDLGGSDPTLEVFKEYESDRKERVTLYLDLSFGPEQITRSSLVSDEVVWRALGELLLGPELRDAWTTEARRYWWEPDAPPYRGADPPVRHVSLHYDRLRGFEHRPSKRSRIFNPAEYRSSDLYRLAKKTYRKLEQLNQLFLENPDCLGCLAKGYSTGKDVLLIQALAVRFAGGVQEGGVGYDYQLLVGDMVRPIGSSNNVEHGYQLPRGAEILYSAEQTWNSPPRLRAGQMLVNASGRDHELGPGEPCGKIRLFSDHHFADDLSLKLQWRQKKNLADEPLAAEYASLGEAQEFTQELADKETLDYQSVRSENTLGSEYSAFDDRVRSMQHGENPFTGRWEAARYFYEIYVPSFVHPPGKKGYTILLRVLNPAGLPVTEEQEILITAPKHFESLVPEECWQLPEPEESKVAGSAAAGP